MVEMWRKPSKRLLLEQKFDSIETNQEEGLTKVYLTRKNLKVEAAYVRKGVTQLNIETAFSNYVRIEAIDHLRRTAWSNPVFYT